MKAIESFHIGNCMKFAKPWDRNLGWAVWLSCFGYLHIRGMRADLLHKEK